MSLRSILVATDRSETAEHAVQFAADMAVRFEAELVLCQVVIPPAEAAPHAKDDLLEYGRPAGIERVRLRLSDAVQEAVRSCGAISTPGVRIEVRVPADLPEIWGDPSRVVVVFRNLVQNALQHAPPESAVVLEGVRAGGKGPGIACTVSDCGKGIREQDLPHLFEPFFSRRLGGTGLGLSIVRRIVEDHGGEVTASNRPGGGAILRVWLPSAA